MPSFVLLNQNTTVIKLLKSERHIILLYLRQHIFPCHVKVHFQYPWLKNKERKVVHTLKKKIPWRHQKENGTF